jgi:hypothetical protein
MKWIDSSRVSLAMSGTALFVALGGSALAVTQITTSQIHNGAVSGAKLKNGAVSSKKLAKGAVTNAKLATGAVGTGKLGSGAVTGPKLAAAAVGTPNLANSAVTGSKLAAAAVGTANLADGAVTSTKIGTGAVTSGTIANGAVGTIQLGTGAVANSNLANNAVTSSKVQHNSLTASDVAPNTFLAANGTAVNSQELGGLTPDGFVRGTARFVSNRVVVPVGQTAPLLELNFAFINAVCRAGAVPVQQFTAELNLENVIYTATNFGAPATSDIQSLNAVTAGNFLEATHTTTTPQSVIWQAAFNDGTDHLATAWTTGQDEGGTCVFTAQGTTSLG